MKICLNAAEAVSDLHRKGFTNDFQLSGNDLLWVRENMMIRAGEFAILEYHIIPGQGRSGKKCIVFGLLALYHNVKGILITPDNRDTNSKWVPVIIKKRNELRKIDPGIRSAGKRLEPIKKEMYN